jgi:hypothetical protein
MNNSTGRFELKGREYRRGSLEEERENACGRRARFVTATG